MADDFTPRPLHFSTVPKSGKPEHAELLGAGMLFAWIATRKGVGKKHGKSLASKIEAREMTGLQALLDVCKKKLTSDDIPASTHAFVRGYTRRLFLGRKDPDGAKRVQELLHLHRPDEISYADDYLGTYSNVVSNPFLVPDTWEAFDRIAPVVDARFEDFQTTKFKEKTPLALYERAARLRDAHAVDVTAPKAKEQKVDDDLANALCSIVGKLLTDKEAKAVLARASLPIGKKIDEQANPPLGVSYMGSKIGGKLAVTSVTFYDDGYEGYVRSMGTSVEFSRWPSALFRKLPAFPLTKDALISALGEPPRASDTFAEWTFTKEKRRLMASFSNKQVSRITWALPREE